MTTPLLILVYLRGGMDALNVLVPYRDDRYFQARPTIALPKPGEAGKAVIPLDDRWAVHPAFETLLPEYERGRLALVTAVGWPGTSYSHFEAWDDIDAGAVGGVRPLNGWLARYLAARPAASSPLRAVAFGDVLPKSLVGALGAVAIRSLADYRLAVGESRRASVRRALRECYAASELPIGRVGDRTLAALESLEHITRRSGERSAYPATSFGEQLEAIERLIRAGVGLEVASLELPGWDTHIGQGTTEGPVARLVGELAGGLATFAERMGDEMHRITIVALSEFGRRVFENGSGGTDHGQGGMMLMLGGTVRGGRVLGRWPGLEALSDVGNVAITTDFREVLGELIAPNLSDTEAVFPNFRFTTGLGLI